MFQGWVIDRPSTPDPQLSGGPQGLWPTYDPLHLEQLEQAWRAGRAGAARAGAQGGTGAQRAAQRGDFFLCAATKQRDFWLGQMTALGRVNPLTYDERRPLESLIAIVPFGVTDDPPVRRRRRSRASSQE